MNPRQVGQRFMRAVLAQVKADEELALVAYKEQFLLYLDRPTVNFGHRRWLEGPQESYDAVGLAQCRAASRVAGARGQARTVFPVERDSGRTQLGRRLVPGARSGARRNVRSKGDASRAIHYAREAALIDAPRYVRLRRDRSSLGQFSNGAWT